MLWRRCLLLGQYSESLSVKADDFPYTSANLQPILEKMKKQACHHRTGSRTDERAAANEGARCCCLTVECHPPSRSSACSTF